MEARAVTPERLQYFGLSADNLPALAAEIVRRVQEKDKAGPLEFRRITLRNWTRRLITWNT